MGSASDFRVQGLPPQLRRFTILSLALAVLCISAEAVCVHVLHLNRPPYSRPLAAIFDYADLNGLKDWMKHFHESGFYSGGFPYPAPVALLYRCFDLPRARVCFLGSLVVMYAALAVWFYRVLRRAGLSARAASSLTVVSACCSYPLYFEANRANMEIFIWLLAGFGALFAYKGRSYSAAALFGLAGACKIFPFLYLGLLVSQKKYRECLWGVAVAAVTTVISLWAAAGSLLPAYRSQTASLATFHDMYVLHRRYLEIGLDHSIFGLLKRWGSPWPLASATLYEHIYLIVASVVGIAAYFLWARKLPFLNQLIFLTVACILLPPVSYDYTLLHLYTAWVPFVLLLIVARREHQNAPRGAAFIVFCFTLLLAPLNELIVRGESFEGQVKCLLLFALAVAALLFPLPTGSAAMRTPSLELGS